MRGTSATEIAWVQVRGCVRFIASSASEDLGQRTFDYFVILDRTPAPPIHVYYLCVTPINTCMPYIYGL